MKMSHFVAVCVGTVMLIAIVVLTASSASIKTIGSRHVQKGCTSQYVIIALGPEAPQINNLDSLAQKYSLSDQPNATASRRANLHTNRHN